MRRFVSSFLFATFAFIPIGVFFAHPASAATSAVIVVDSDGQATAADCNAAGAVPPTIQGGVDAASPGDTVKVCPGVYPGDVTITKAGLIVKGAKAGQSGDRATTAGNPAGESVITGAQVTINANSVTFDGFLIQNNTNGPGMQTTATTSGATIIDNVFRDNVFGLYAGNEGTQLMIVRANRFTTNNADGAASGNGIYTDQGLNGADIYNNTFNGQGNAAILVADLANNVRIHNNMFADDNSEVNVFGAKALRIYDNVATNSATTTATGSQIRIDGANTDGVLIQHNTLQNAAFDGIAIRGGVNIEVLSNMVSGAKDNGIDVTAADPGVVEVRDNEVSTSAVYGIRMGPDTKENFVSRNNSHDNGTFDCRDETTGPNRGGVANYWTNDNATGTSSPSNLCSPK